MPHPVLFVIDDDAGVAGTLRDDLGRRFGEDFCVIGASSAAAALETLRELADQQAPVNLLIVCHKTREMAGVAFLKPDHIYDRDREWAGLVQFATSDSSDVRLGIVSGRRRQGKTYLLDAAATAFGGSSLPPPIRPRPTRWPASAGPWPALAGMTPAVTRSPTGMERCSGCSGW